MKAWILAEWIELAVLSSGKRWTRGNVQTVLQREAIDDAEAALSVAWMELEARAQLFEEQWPLRFDSRDALQLRRKKADRLLYYFLCLLSFDSGVSQEGRELFERCVADVLRALGVSDSFRIGFPPRGELGATFRAAVEEYARRTHEELIKPPLGSDNDLGLDVVGWIDLGDARCGTIHVLGQCATGWNWPDKLADLSLDVWRNHVGWAVDPLRFVAVPHSVQTLGEEWRRRNNRGGVILDRLRLIRLHRRAPLKPGTREQVEQFCLTAY